MKRDRSVIRQRDSCNDLVHVFGGEQLNNDPYSKVPIPRPMTSWRQYTVASTVVSYAGFGRHRLVDA